jgi:hypothetical protein
MDIRPGRERVTNMARQRLDPEHQDAVLFGVKLGYSDAEKVIELAREAGLCRSEYLRGVLLGALERDTGQPEDN